ncbi:MAG: sulfotransferase [Gammaproteobacteria bacterium]
MDLQRAERGLHDRRVGEAETICQSVLAERPDHVWALRLMAEVRLKQSRPDLAWEFINQALDLDISDPLLFNIRGRILNNRNELDEAEADFRQALELDPQFADAHSNLGHVLRRKGYKEAAEQCFRSALSHKPEHGNANLNLGSMLYEQGHIELAIRHLERGLKEEMVNRPGRYNLAIAQHQVGRLDEAVHNYRQVIAEGERDPDVFSNLSSVLMAMGDLTIAAAGFETALEIDPDHAPSLAGLAGLLELNGEFKRGIALLLPYLKQGTASPTMRVAYARLLRRLERGKEALLHLAPLASDKSLADHERSAIHFTLGDLLDDLKEYDRAFAHYRRANKFHAGKYSRAGREREIERLMNVFNRDNMSRLPHCERNNEFPVFIVGMPRSGTSLVEQILASHEEIYGAGELRELGLAAMSLGRNKHGVPYPECLEILDSDLLGDASSRYVERLMRNRGKVERITDKMWQNFEQLGLIQLVLPKARVIHCQRDPVDTGLSCFQQSFGSVGPPFSYDLGDIAHYYGQYRRLMEHWEEHLDLQILDVRYEDLVSDTENETRRMLKFLDLDWDPDCLKFYDNPRLVRTASHAQVKRPVYTSSVGRADHYRKHLGPLLAGLRTEGFLGE